MMTAAEKLYDLWKTAKAEPNSAEYITELCNQIELFGTESNKLTRDYILNSLEKIVNKIKATFEEDE